MPIYASHHASIYSSSMHSFCATWLHNLQVLLHHRVSFLSGVTSSWLLITFSISHHHCRANDGARAFPSVDLGFVCETGVLGGTLLLAPWWARRQERKQRRWSAIDTRLHTAHGRGARVTLKDTKLFTTMNGRTAYIGCGSLPMTCATMCSENSSRPHESVISLYIQSQNSAPPSK